MPARRSLALRLAPLLPTLALAAACSPPANSAADGAAKKKRDESIGALAAAQGGLASLGDASASASGYEVALSGPLRAELLEAPVKIDGVLKEWPRRAAVPHLRGATDGVTFSVALQYDDARLYVAGEVEDPNYVRTARFSELEDHASLSLAFPGAAGKYRVHELGLFAGKPGETAGSVRHLSGPERGREVAGARIVEAPQSRGYSFEAQIPWSTFPEAHTLRVGLRGALRYHDGDGASERGVLATSAGDAQSPSLLSPLPTAPEQAVVEGLLQPRGAAAEVPRIDVFADVAGDAMKERVSVFQRYITICGPGYRSGKQFFYRELSGEVLRVEARDLGRPSGPQRGQEKEALLLRRRVSGGGRSRESLEVWMIGANDEPQTIFAHEIAVTNGPRGVANAVRVGRGEIEVSVEPASGGWDASSYHEATSSDMEPVLLPWGTVKSRLYRLEGTRFERASEVIQAGDRATAKLEAPPPVPSIPRDPPTPPVHRGGDLSQLVLEQYQRDQGVAAGARPKVDLQVQVSGDARPERVLLVGRDLVVLGPGYKGGNQYSFARLGEFAAPEDITELTARDITGDGIAELVVRGKVKLSPTVDSEVLLVYSASSERVVRLLSVETAREAQGGRVQGLVQFVPGRGGHGFEIDVRPGIVRGWTEKTCPFGESEPSASSVPVLLPWGKLKNLRYTWNGTAFARQ